jgi:hypothetical protein
MDPEDENTHFVPVGNWADGFGSGYNITTTTLDYYTPEYGPPYPSPATNTKGIIEEANDFSSDAGVLLVRITSSNTGITVNKYIGVYYRDYTPTHVFLANAIDGSYATIEKNTLDEARNAFTVDNVDTHVTFWGSGYNK